MTIVDAILKAKQKGLEPPALGKPERSSGPQADRVHVQEPNKPARAPVLGEHVAIERAAFKVASHDAATCGSWHVIAPNSDPHLSRVGAPAYRMLRARTLQLCRNNHWRTVALSSPGPGEGKSVTAINLAISIAREGNYDVFLLDLDLRNPSVCRYLGVEPPQELNRYFSGDIAAKEVFFTLAGVDRLTVAGATHSEPNASELLASRRLHELLSYVESLSVNPLILVDLPPIVNTDDALVVAPHLDAIILVVSEGITRRDSLSQAIGLLADFKIAGIALNRSAEPMGSAYYGNY